MKTFLVGLSLVAAIALTAVAQTPAAPPAAPAKTDAVAKKAPAAPKKVAEVTPAPTATEIADAKAKGMVWVNLGTKVYHKDGDFYGKTKRGKFMTEADAKAGGFKAAQEPVAKKKTPAAPKDAMKKTADAPKK